MTGHCPWIAAILLFELISTGCGNHVSDDLEGRWIGRPDTAPERLLRDQRRYRSLESSVSIRARTPDSRGGPASPEPRGRGASDRRPLGLESSAGAELSAQTDRVEVTDWEKLEAGFDFYFHGDGRIDMSLADGSQPRTGWWRVVQQTPATILIEIETSSPTGRLDDPNSDPTERRRFELLPDYESGHCVGFLLHELDADPLLGSLYFTRQE